MSLFKRSAVSEILSHSGVVLSTLLIVWLSVLLVRLLGEAANGTIGPDVVLGLAAFSSITALPIILAVSLFIAVLTTVIQLGFTRAARASDRRRQRSHEQTVIPPREHAGDDARVDEAVGHGQVEKHDIRLVDAQRALPLGPVARQQHLVAIELQRPAQRVPHGAIVVDEVTQIGFAARLLLPPGRALR